MATMASSTPASGAATDDALELGALLEAAEAAARAAGELMLAATTEGRAVAVTKANSKDLLTLTDSACQRRIQKVLAERCPSSRFLGEEDVAPGPAAAAKAAEVLLTDGVWWVVDPIDGTANFVDGIPLSTVSIAAVRNCQTVAGVVYDPHRDELFAATLKGGATLNKRPISVNNAGSLAESIVYAGAPPGDAALAPSLRGILAVAPKARTMRMLGSAALMLAYVAAGRGAAYFEADLAAWDTAAGALLIKEAGGAVTDAAGDEHSPVTRQIVATNGHIHAELLATLAAVDAAKLDNDPIRFPTQPTPYQGGEGA